MSIHSRELTGRLASCTRMIETFLTNELSAGNLSAGRGAIAYLDQFRSFLASFYSVKLGQYPLVHLSDGPNTTVLKSMLKDFEALYNLLANETVTADQVNPANGGICARQLVHSFDSFHGFDPLPYPLPRLPAPTEPESSRLSWVPGLDRLRLERNADRSVIALGDAYNVSDPDILLNPLVTACRAFEGETILFPLRQNRQERVTLADARKMRWLLVYAVYQVLRRIATIPAGEIEEEEQAKYHLFAKLPEYPPWEDTPAMRAQRAPLAGRHRHSMMPFSNAAFSPEVPSAPSRVQPDVAYGSMRSMRSMQSRNVQTPEASENGGGGSARGLPRRRASLPSPAGTAKPAINRASTLRRSFRIFGREFSSPPVTSGRGRSPYHEILVHGYGNGTNHVNLSSNDQAGANGAVAIVDQEDEQVVVQNEQVVQDNDRPVQDNATSSGDGQAIPREEIGVAITRDDAPGVEENQNEDNGYVAREWPLRSSSYASRSAGSGPDSMDTAERTASPSPVNTPPPLSPDANVGVFPEEPVLKKKHSTIQRGREVFAKVARTLSGRAARRAEASGAIVADAAAVVPQVPALPETPIEQQAPPERSSSFVVSSPRPLPARNSFLRRMTMPAQAAGDEMQPVPARPGTAVGGSSGFFIAQEQDDSFNDDHLQAFLDPRTLEHQGNRDVVPSFEQYQGLGGLMDYTAGR